jgi:hypothetical protein
MSSSSKNWYMWPQHHVEQQFQLTHPVGFIESLLCKVELETGSLDKLKKKKNNDYQHYNILSAYEVKDETSTNSTYVSLVFYRTVRSRKMLVKK